MKKATPSSTIFFNGIVVSPDGKYLYMNSGSRSDHGEVEDAKGAFPDTREVPLTSAIFRVPTDTDDQVLPNDEAALKSKGFMFADGTAQFVRPGVRAKWRSVRWR